MPDLASGRIVCSRCQQPVRRKPAHAANICDEGIALDEQPMPTAKPAPAPFRSNDWPERSRVRKLQRELKRPSILAKNTAATASGDMLRIEMPHVPARDFDFVTNEQPMPTAPPLPATIVPQRRTGLSQAIAWFVVTLGMLTLGTGVGLIAWSISTHTMTYWTTAIGLSFGGQGVLILGLVLVVSRLWRHSRYAAGKLQEVNSQLGQLQQTAELLTTLKSGGSSPAFYTDLARGASPHLLFANLKGQLDQLAVRLGT
jgi:hypothetical protein